MALKAVELGEKSKFTQLNKHFQVVLLFTNLKLCQHSNKVMQ